MSFLQVYVDDRTLSALVEASRELGRPVEDLAEAAVSEAAVAYENSKPALPTPGDQP